MNKYHILKQLAASDYADVYLAEHTALRDMRIIKRIAKKSACYQQLIQEAYIMKNLKHSNIPLIYDMEEDEEYSYIIEEYIDGESLVTYTYYQNNIQLEVIIDLIIQLATTIQFLHSMDPPILYLDLKPENIIVSHDRIKLIDFGSSILSQQACNREFSFGTPSYAAPEQRGLQPVDERSDIYGLGRVMEYLVNNQRRNRKKLFPIISKCIKNNPEQRYQSVQELLTDLLILQNSKKTLYESRPQRIAILGAKPGIGCTHISLALTISLRRQGRDAVYYDRNGHVLPMLLHMLNSEKKESGLWNIDQGVLQAALLPEENEKMSTQNTSISICDCGCLEDDTVYDYEEKYDFLVVLMGNPIWDVTKNEQIERSLLGHANYMLLCCEGGEIPRQPVPFKGKCTKRQLKIWDQWAGKCIDEIEKKRTTEST